MKKTFNTFVYLFAMLQPLTSQNIQTVFFSGGNICDTTPYQLVFHDEFDGNILDTNTWKPYFPWGPNNTDSCPFCRTHSFSNKQEGQIYRNENVRVSNGKLHLDVKEEIGTWFEFTKNYSSGMIYSIQPFTTYTKFEIRCKIPEGVGYFPAFWAFGWNTEIDVFEFKEVSNELECPVHYWDNYYPNPLPFALPSWLLNLNIPQFHKYVYLNNFLSEDFHTYSVEYEPFFVNFYLDEELIVTLPRYYTLDGQPVLDCTVLPGIYIQHPEFPKYGNHLNAIANVALLVKNASRNEVFPNTMEIEYIRVFQKNPQSGLNNLCDNFQISGNNNICSNNENQDTVLYCFNGPLSNTSEFKVSENLKITQNPAYNLIVTDTTYLVNGFPFDTVFIDTSYMQNCIRVTSHNKEFQGFGNISVNIKDDGVCGNKTFNYPVQIGIPEPVITFEQVNPCKKDIVLSTLNYGKSTTISWTIYDKGNLTSMPNIKYTNGNKVVVNITNQQIFNNSFFFVKLKITTDCGVKEIVRKVQLKNSNCRVIEYLLIPNPAVDYVTLQFEDNESYLDIKSIIIAIITTSEVLYQKDNFIGQDDLTLDISSINNGVYTLFLISHNLEIVSQVLNINR